MKKQMQRIRIIKLQIRTKNCRNSISLNKLFRMKKWVWIMGKLGTKAKRIRVMSRG